MSLISSWNVNSLGARLEHVLTWLKQSNCDVLALQETKTQDENFPFDAFIEEGYELIVSGQKSYNGVAFVSKKEGMDVHTEIPGLNDPQKRLLAATFGSLRLVNVYVPNGESLESEKFDYKLTWLKAFHEYIEEELKRYPKMVILGDFNIAPTEKDVHDATLWKDCILVSEQERTALKSLLDLGFTDSFRLFAQEEGSFSWWDYRAGSIRANRGLRIDLILTSLALKEQVLSSSIDRAPRAWERPSDHTPVTLKLCTSQTANQNNAESGAR